jgi:hypothetical protein
MQCIIYIFEFFCKYPCDVALLPLQGSLEPSPCGHEPRLMHPVAQRPRHTMLCSQYPIPAPPKNRQGASPHAQTGAIPATAAPISYHAEIRIKNSNLMNFTRAHEQNHFSILQYHLNTC